MRKVLAAAVIGAAVLVPFASSASASCIAVTEDLCVSPPCPAGYLNALDDKLGDHLDPFACMT